MEVSGCIWYFIIQDDRKNTYMDRDIQHDASDGHSEDGITVENNHETSFLESNITQDDSDDNNIESNNSEGQRESDSTIENNNDCDSLSIITTEDPYGSDSNIWNTNKIEMR